MYHSGLVDQLISFVLDFIDLVTCFSCKFGNNWTGTGRWQDVMQKMNHPIETHENYKLTRPLLDSAPDLVR